MHHLAGIVQVVGLAGALLATGPGCVASTSPALSTHVPAVRYRVVCSDSAMEANHGQFYVVEEIHVPEMGFCFNRHGGAVNAFLQEKDRRPDGTPNPSSWSGDLDVWAHQFYEEIRIPRAIAEKMKRLARARADMDELASALSGDPEIGALVREVKDRPSRWPALEEEIREVPPLPAEEEK